MRRVGDIGDRRALAAPSSDMIKTTDRSKSDGGSCII
jgi:hypothetical protein